MGLFEDFLAAMQTQGSQLAALTAEISQLREKVAPSREIYTLRDLAELPEVSNLKTLRNNPERQPNGGQPDGFKGTQKAWYRETVEAWRRQLSPRSDAMPGLELHRAVG